MQQELINLGFKIVRESTMEFINGGIVLKYNLDKQILFIENQQGLFELPTINSTEKIKQFIELLN